MYSVREAAAKDLGGVLKAVADMGYEGVEFAGMHGHDADQVRAWLDEAGLKCISTHLVLDDVTGDTLDETVAYNKVLGNRDLIVAGLPPDRHESAAGLRETAAFFNELVERCKAVDMRTGYHAHPPDFTKVDGEYPWDIVFSSTTPDFIMQIDTGNSLRCGVDSCPFIERYPGRARTAHLKEFTEDPGGALIGDGVTDWEKVFSLCESVGGTEWYVVEQESYPVPPMEAARGSLANLRRMGK
jgi:sugar phosphate isomerase/epimerase